jgi:hypothetical protein
MVIWKDVVGYEGLYEVSDKGQVRTHKNKVTSNSRYEVRHWQQRILKEKKPKGRDIRVSLWKDGKPKSFLAHRLVAMAFIPMIPGKDSINHIDGNPRNNHVENLEWCDHKENNNHAFDNGLIPSHNVVIYNIKTKQRYEFRSKQKASEFLGKNHGYVSCLLKRGKNIYGNFLIKEFQGKVGFDA